MPTKEIMNARAKRTHIIAGVAGVGKTHLANEDPGVLDVDFRYHSKAPDFPHNYLEHMRHVMDQLIAQESCEHMALKAGQYLADLLPLRTDISGETVH